MVVLLLLLRATGRVLSASLGAGAVDTEVDDERQRTVMISVVDFNQIARERLRL